MGLRPCILLALALGIVVGVSANQNCAEAILGLQLDRLLGEKTALPAGLGGTGL